METSVESNAPSNSIPAGPSSRVFGLDEAYPNPADSRSLRSTTIHIVAVHGLDTTAPDTWVFENHGNPGSEPVNWLSDHRMLPNVVAGLANSPTTGGAMSQGRRGHETTQPCRRPVVVNPLPPIPGEELGWPPAAFYCVLFWRTRRCRGSEPCSCNKQSLFFRPTGVRWSGVSRHTFWWHNHNSQSAVARGIPWPNGREHLARTHQGPRQEQRRPQQPFGGLRKKLKHRGLLSPHSLLLRDATFQSPQKAPKLLQPFLNVVKQDELLVSRESACLPISENNSLQGTHVMMNKIAPNTPNFHRVAAVVKTFVDKAEDTLMNRQTG